MPIRVQNDLPVKEILEQENIFVMDEMRAAHQDIRPISIGLLNLMPLKEDTELQILRALSNSPLQVDVTFVRVTSHVSKNTSTSHIYKFYEAFDDIKDKRFDGFIITQLPASCIMELRKEVLPMTRSEAIKAFFFKSVLPVTMALILYCIFKSACVKNGELDYVWLWILCGLPFGLHRMCLWIVPGGGSLGGGIALFALNFIIGGVIGGFVLTWRLIVAVWYVPLTVYWLIVG